MQQKTSTRLPQLMYRSYDEPGTSEKERAAGARMGSIFRASAQVGLHTILIG